MPRLRSKSTEARIYWRTRGGVRRAYLDVRDYRDVADKPQQALIPPGKTRATTNPDEAERLAAGLIVELEKRREAAPRVVAGDLRLESAILEHLDLKRGIGEVGTAWMAQAVVHLSAAADYFKPDRRIDTITPREVLKFSNHLRTLPNKRGGQLGPGTVNQYLNSLSDMFVSAQLDGDGRVGNPVERLPRRHRPKKGHVRSKWLEISEVVAILEWARRFTSERPYLATPFLYELVAAYALTGCRRTEVLGLRREDVDLTARTINLVPNEWRELKTPLSARTVQVPPQLVEILQAYESGPNAPQGDLYFPSPKDAAGREAMLGDFEKLLDHCEMPGRFTRRRTASEMHFAKLQREKAVDARHRKMLRDAKARGRDDLSAKQKATLERLAEIKIPETVTQPLRPLLLRHTWCAARLQCVKSGMPISLIEVATEMGHANLNMIQKTYGHLLSAPRRGEFVEYKDD